MADVNKMFQPSSIGWLSLTAERMRGKNKEDPEITSKFKEMKKIRRTLKKIEEGMEKWAKQMKQLYSVSKKLSSVVETNEKVRKECSWNGDILLKDKVALKNVKEKIRRLDELLAQRKILKYIRLKGNQAQHKLEKLRKHEQRESYERQSTRYLSIHKEAVQQREDIMSQVLLVIDKCLDEVHQFGVAYLVKPQLQSFKMAQFHMFLVCQKLIQGKHEDSHLAELEEHWNVFTNRVAEEIPHKHKGGSLDGSHPFLREALLAAQERDEEESLEERKKEKPSVLDSDKESEYAADDIEVGSDGELDVAAPAGRAQAFVPSDTESDDSN